jgi:regulator of replication initiation timing
VPGIAVQGPLFTFGGDGIGPETDSVMLFTTASGRKRPRGNDGFDAESGPIRRIPASQFGTVNAKLDKALGKMASQQEEIEHLKQKLGEVMELKKQLTEEREQLAEVMIRAAEERAHNRQQWNLLNKQWASIAKITKDMEQKISKREPPRGQPEHRVEELQTPAFQGRECGQRASPIPPRPRETAAQPEQ